jgi:hypothetical protein
VVLNSNAPYQDCVVAIRDIKGLAQDDMSDRLTYWHDKNNPVMRELVSCTDIVKHRPVALPHHFSHGRCIITIAFVMPNVGLTLDSVQSIVDTAEHLSKECILKAHRTGGWTSPSYHGALMVTLRISADARDPVYQSLMRAAERYRGANNATGSERYEKALTAARDYFSQTGRGPYP